MLLNQINLLIFDMDGLLIDTEHTYREGWKYAFNKNNINVNDDIITSWVGKSVHETGKQLLELCGSEEIYIKIREDRESYIYDSLYKDEIKVMPYAKEVLKLAKENGYVTGLATSSHKKRAVDVLTYLGLIEYIDIPVFGDSVERLKPFPDLYNEVLVQAKTAADYALALEDSITGAKAADAANIKTILVPDCDSKENLSELPGNVIIKAIDLSVLKKWMTIFN
ncbi:MAG: HAD family phosphatase [Erysipelotrichaceae bacterium]